MSQQSDLQQLARTYLDTMGRRDFRAFEALLAPDVVFRGPSGTLSGVREVLPGYERLGAMLVRNELKRLFVDGNEICIIYDFVTNTSVGAVPTVEWLRIEDGKVASIWLLTDHVRFPSALDELRHRTAAE